MKWLLFTATIFLNACSNLPANIQHAPTVDIQLNQAAKNASDIKNSPIRWGGTVINVENEADNTSLQILSYPLNFYGRPLINLPSSGRFTAISNQFLDPAIFTKGTEITIAGKFHGILEKQIGAKTITVPVLAIEEHHIWPQYQPNYYGTYNYYPYYSGYRYRNYPYSSFRGRYGYRYYNCY